MPSQLLDIPEKLLIELFNKFTFRSLCRIRRANKGIDSFVENHRFRIGARSEGTPIILRFYVDSEAKPSLLIDVAEAEFEWGYRYRFEMHRIPKEKIKEIEKPYEQLSAIKFDAVYLHQGYLFPTLHRSYRRNQVNKELRRRQRRVFQTQVFPLLEKLRLSSERLTTEGCQSENVNDILPRVRYKKITLDGSFSRVFTCEALMALPIQHIKERNIFGPIDIPTRIAPLLSGAKNALLYFFQKDNIDHLLVDFLKELRETNESSLEYFAFSSAETNDNYFLLIPDLIPIWKGREEYHFAMPISSVLNAYLFRLRHGMVAFVLSSWLTGNMKVRYVHFVKEEKEILFNLLCNTVLSAYPIDRSACYDEFMETENLVEAFGTIQKRYYSQK